MGKIDNAVILAKSLQLNYSVWPVNLLQLAERLNITVKIRDLVKCSGLYVSYENKHYIIINERQPEYRQLWTLAHETCHHLMPSTQSEKCIVEYYSDRERACNAFAAELLMPERYVRLYLPKFLTGDWDDISMAMAKFFGVSKQAALFRLEELRIIEDTSIEYLQQLKEAYKAVEEMNSSEYSKLTAAAQIADFITGV